MQESRLHFLTSQNSTIWWILNYNVNLHSKFEAFILFLPKIRLDYKNLVYFFQPALVMYHGLPTCSSANQENIKLRLKGTRGRVQVVWYHVPIKPNCGRREQRTWMVQSICINRYTFTYLSSYSPAQTKKDFIYF